MLGRNGRAGFTVAAILLLFGATGYWIGKVDNYCLPEIEAGADDGSHASDKSDADNRGKDNLSPPPRRNYSITADGQGWVRCTENKLGEPGLEPAEWAAIASAIFAACLTLASFGMWASSNQMYETSRIQAQAAINAGRAFLTPDKPQIIGHFDPKREPQETMYFNAAVSNRGLGPGFLHYIAVAHEVCLNDKIRGKNEPKISDYLGRVMIDKNGSWNVAGVNLTYFKLTDEEIEEIKKGSSFLHVYGYFRYEDMFGVLRETGFHYSHDPKAVARSSNANSICGLTGSFKAKPSNSIRSHLI